MATIKSEMKSRTKSPQVGDKLWFSKYALTHGLEQLVVESVNGLQITPKGYSASYELGKDLHETWEQAEAAAKASLRKKIVQLEKQMLILRKMTFKPK